MQFREDRHSREDWRATRPVLIVGHPGHELRLYGWLSLVQPTVAILTDGSGRHGNSRVPSTRRLLDRSGARESAILGICTDQQIYRALLANDVQFFIDAATRLTETVLSRDHRLIIADPIEGYNPTHDICSLLGDAVAHRVAAITRRAPAVLSYALMRRDVVNGHKHRYHMILSKPTLKRKLRAGEDYEGLEDEVSAIIDNEGESLQRAETLVRRTPGRSVRFFAGKPYYETYGEKKLAEGHYSDVIRYRQHFQPAANALLQWATSH